MNELTLPATCWCPDAICTIVYYLNSLFSRERDRVKEGYDFSQSPRQPLGPKIEEMGADKAPAGVAQVWVGPIIIKYSILSAPYNT